MGKKYMNDYVVAGHYAEPIVVTQIIKGIIREVYNPATGKTTKVGNGEVLWDISDTRKVPYMTVVLSKNMGLKKDYLKFKAVENSTIGYQKSDSLTDINIYYKLNNTGWLEWDGSDIVLNVNDEIMVKNTSNVLSNPTSRFYFRMSGKIEASGSIMSLINFSELTPNCFTNLFYDCSALTKAPDLPATELVEGCYSNMFKNCSELIKAPDLPATTLATYCYSFMFSGCSKLTSIKLNYIGNFNASFNNWVYGVNSQGILYYNGLDTKKGNSSIPTNFEVQSF